MLSVLILESSIGYNPPDLAQVAPVIAYKLSLNGALFTANTKGEGDTPRNTLGGQIQHTRLASKGTNVAQVQPKPGVKFSGKWWMSVPQNSLDSSGLHCRNQ
jgi:hypothetical protein